MADHKDRGARLLSREPIHKGFVTLERLRLSVRSPAGEAEIEREVHSHGHVAAVLPVDPARRTGVLVRQFRTGPFLAGEEAWLVELPAGLIGDEEPEACARREAKEETGLDVADLRPLGTTWSSPGVVFERIHLYWGCYDGPPRKRHAGLEEESELIEVVELPLREILAMCVDGRVEDAKSVVGVLRLAALEPSLFA